MARNGDTVELNLRGVNEVMKSEGVAKELARRAQRVASAAGPGVESEVNNDHRWVARAWAIIKTAEAAKREGRTNNLTRSIDAGRGV